MTKDFRLILPAISIVFNAFIYFLDITNSELLNCASSTIGLPCINVFGAIVLLLNTPAFVVYSFINPFLGDITTNQEYAVVGILSVLFYFVLGLVLDKIKNRRSK